MPVLFGIFLSALRTALGFVFRSLVIKFVVFFALFFVVKELVNVLVSSNLYPGATQVSALSSALSGIPESVWYFLDLFSISTGLSTVISAYATRFIIRRIPVIG
ncbi:DUF2523 family protein [Janthinobacterium sp. SUN026]|uniref:DUF2523 family protein n=1 Tax=Janthinobacterium sp. SUN026 TaxID=3002438 RepID=UPI0025AF496D|nr:DUF2523 family protein [Janthinobacterium sp. SUN026]MDN2672862.1 DUF2523 family protein [Janthinobacterium sp. SUN026]